MERWNRLNVYFSIVGLIIFIISLLLVNKMPLFVLLAAFGLGIAFKGFKNIYKKTPPPKENKIKNPYDTKTKKKKKK